MSLISMAVYDTEENDRTKYTQRTLESLSYTVDWNKHRIIIVDNASCEATKETLEDFLFWVNGSFGIDDPAKVITNEKNLGTAEAINLAWKERRPGEHCIKIDNDIIVHADDWADQLEEVARRDNKIGQVGLKRVDCIESTTNTNPFYKSIIRQLPHHNGERWIIVESQFHVMGSCVLHTSELLDKIGYMYQIGVYGFDDSFMSYRARCAGFDTVMLPHILIEHIDTGDNPYQKIKEAQAGKVFADGMYQKELARFKSGDYYYNPFK